MLGHLLILLTTIDRITAVSFPAIVLPHLFVPVSLGEVEEGCADAALKAEHETLWRDTTAHRRQCNFS